ncbi:diaminopimelate epimerase [Planomonospora sp. ID82291]|uniref:diaminopimelate epimerase n=1 Tax=Planomonospora sp. ID82291 TaxID=2738136 RepID=UPI0018C3FC65|nr:diaminopimelate epimerase [Planomonospora sp. ID82291]MBG0816096.1 diaminopimelate epimerase [Planomonospora sp. ID82291]
MRDVEVLKTHGSKNDIFIIETDYEGAEEAELVRLVRAVCDRSGPLGGDGVYFVDRVEDTPRAAFFNPDGSRADLCGNGMRCLGRYVLERRGETSTQIRSGRHRFTVRDRGTTDGVRQVSVDLPPVSFRADDPIVAGSEVWIDRPLPVLDAELRFSALAVPNSHLVAIVDRYEEEELVRVGGTVAARPDAFPIGANVSFVRSLGPDEIFVRTYERGVGLTPSCGSATVASSAVYSRLAGNAGTGRLTVRNLGGSAKVVLREEDGRLRPTLEGNATFVHRANVRLGDAPDAGSDAFVLGESFAAEIAAYENVEAENVIRLKEKGIAV